MRRGLNLYGRELVVEISLLTRCDILYEAEIYTRTGTYFMPHHFSETINTIAMEFTFSVGTSFTGL
jgi:hypothetical protein